MKQNIIQRAFIGKMLALFIGLSPAGRAVAQNPPGISILGNDLEWQPSETMTKTFLVYTNYWWQLDTTCLGGHFIVSPVSGAYGCTIEVTPVSANTDEESIFETLYFDAYGDIGASINLTHLGTNPSNNQGGNNNGGNNGGNSGGSNVTLEWSSHDLSQKPATITVATGGIWDADTTYLSSPFTLSSGTGASGDVVYISPKAINHGTEDVTDTFFFEARSGDSGMALNLIQHGVVYSVETSPSEIVWDADSLESRTVTVTAIGDWTAAVNGAGFSVTGGSGLDNGSFIVHPVGLYYGRGNRTATLSVTCHGITRTINLVQRRSDQSLGIAGNWMLKRSQYAIGTNAFNEDIVFYNGLGYAEQTVLVGASPQQSKNIVTPIVYDAMMRADARTYLPYVSTGTTATEVAPATAIANQASWYGERYNGEGQYANAVQEYEASPLERVTAARKPGQTYAVNDKKVAYGYDTNTASEVLKLSVNSSGGLEVDGWYAGKNGPVSRRRE